MKYLSLALVLSLCAACGPMGASAPSGAGEVSSATEGPVAPPQAPPENNAPQGGTVNPSTAPEPVNGQCTTPPCPEKPATVSSGPGQPINGSGSGDPAVINPPPPVQLPPVDTCDKTAVTAFVFHTTPEEDSTHVISPLQYQVLLTSGLFTPEQISAKETYAYCVDLGPTGVFDPATEPKLAGYVVYVVPQRLHVPILPVVEKQIIQ